MMGLCMYEYCSRTLIVITMYAPNSMLIKWPWAKRCLNETVGNPAHVHSSKGVSSTFGLCVPLYVNIERDRHSSRWTHGILVPEKRCSANARTCVLTLSISIPWTCSNHNICDVSFPFHRYSNSESLLIDTNKNFRVKFTSNPQLNKIKLRTNWNRFSPV